MEIFSVNPSSTTEIILERLTPSNDYSLKCSDSYGEGEFANIEFSKETLEKIYRAIGAHLFSIGLTRYKKTMCKLEVPTSTVYEYAVDTFDDVRKAEDWLFSQDPKAPIEEIERKIGAIKYGVYL